MQRLELSPLGNEDDHHFLRFGTFQYGDLHLPQRLGRLRGDSGSHSWPHREQTQTVRFFVGMWELYTNGAVDVK